MLVSRGTVKFTNNSTSARKSACKTRKPDLRNPRSGFSSLQLKRRSFVVAHQTLKSHGDVPAAF
jgi:hypothetical protein